jgi:hypothetical protein
VANIVRNPYSNTAGNTPTSLVNGQIAVNQADGKLFYRSSAGVVTALSTGSGGDPITPSSIGAAATSHVHSASDITSGTLSQARLDFIPIHPFLLMGG